MREEERQTGKDRETDTTREKGKKTGRKRRESLR